jgi:hypothetical protein
MNVLSTTDLLLAINDNINHYIEARLLLKYNGNATHFLYFDGNMLFDEGIDGEEQKISFVSFYNNYFNGFWVIDNII